MRLKKVYILKIVIMAWKYKKNETNIIFCKCLEKDASAQRLLSASADNGRVEEAQAEPQENMQK